MKSLFKFFLMILFILILNACGGSGGGGSGGGSPKPNPTSAVITLTCSSVVTQLCNQFSNYTLYVKESNVLVESISLNLNATTTISDLKPNTDYIIYSNGIANAKDNIFAKVVERSFRAGNSINVVITKLESISTYQVNFNVTTSDSGVVNTNINYNTSNNNNQYNYVNQYNISNGNNIFYFATNDAANFKINQVNVYSLNIESGLVSLSQTYNIVFTSTTPPLTKVKNWPNYLAMGAVGGSNNTDFNGVYVDSVFKYGGESGTGDEGIIVDPLNVYNMYKDFNLIANNNNLPINITMVEYTAEYSTDTNNISEFTNIQESTPLKSNIMLKHFISLGLDTIALNKNPIVLNNKKYYGSIILSPDLIGTIQQQNKIASINTVLQNPANNLNLVLRQLVCFLTKNNVQYTYNSIQYNDTAYNIFESILKVNYDDAKTAWNVMMPDILQNCIANPDTQYTLPNLESNLNGWVKANNWIIKTFGQNNISFGWQDNIWAVNNGSWVNVNRDLNSNEVQTQYSDPLLSWIKTNIPAIYESGLYKPDFIVFDRYERDDSLFYSHATLYNDHSWNNYIVAIDQVTKGLNNIPIMLWQIPGPHILLNSETVPMNLDPLGVSRPVFGITANYFFGDSNLDPNFTNVNSVVSSFMLESSWSKDQYRFIGSFVDYIKGGDYNWIEGKDSNNVRGLQKIVNANVFAVLWGGGNSTNVITNFSNKGDNDFLKNAVNNYNNPSDPKRINLLP